MQEGPDVKPVSRAELYPDSDSTELHESDRTIKEVLEEQFKQDYLSLNVDLEVDRTIEQNWDETNQGDDGGKGLEEVETFDFRLFSKPTLKPSGSAGTGNTPSKINIRSPSPPVGEPGFVRPHRLSSYYFTGEADSVKKKQFRASAISGRDVIDELRRRWQGNELPWRVITWRTTGVSTVPKQTSFTIQGSSGRKRAGKKTRIATRKKVVFLQAQRTQAALSQHEKDAADREKRTRRNREKKVKKKERDKSKKAAKS